MKHFIIRSFVFFIPVAALLAGWEICMRNFPHAQQLKKDVILEKCRKSGEIVFLGSSHTFFGVNTDVLPHSYNLGYVSQTLLQDRFIFELLVSKQHRLKYVVVPISVFSFFQPVVLERWRIRNYVRYWGYPAESIQDKFFILDNIPLQFIYVRKNLKKLKKKGLYKTLNISPTGWGTSYKKADNFDFFEKAGLAAAQHHCNVNMDDTIIYQEALKNIIKLARQQNIKVILCTLPGHKTYYKNINIQQERKMRSIIADIVKENGVSYLDLLRSAEFKDEDFFDPDHLSHKGAKKLALKLYEFCKNQ